MNEASVPTLWSSLFAVAAIAAVLCGGIAGLLMSGSPWHRLYYAVPCSTLAFAAALYATHQTFSVGGGAFVYHSLFRSRRIPIDAITEVRFQPANPISPRAAIVVRMTPTQRPDGTPIGRGEVFNLGNWASVFPDGTSWATKVDDFIRHN